MQAVDQHISAALKHYAALLEAHFKCDVIAYMGPIYPATLTRYKEQLEALKGAKPKPPGHDPNKLAIVLTTPGGVVEIVEKMVNITRHHYGDVSFVIPDMAMSAGTVWCMSGDRIWMDYASSLGPIDPQVQSANGNLVPALGYLDKVKELIERSKQNALTAAEVVMLKSMDLAELRRYEQAKDLSISLLKEWLVKFKFKNWTHHRTNGAGAPVTQAEKEARAQQIAEDLISNNKWRSHSRMIGMDKLKSDIRLEIDDYTQVMELGVPVRIYNSLLAESLERQGSQVIVHSARG